MAVRQTFDIQFYCRKSKMTKKGLAPIEVSIIINGKRNYLTLQRKENPDVFKTEMESKKPNPIKSYCESERRLIDEYVLQMQFEGIPLTASNLKDCLKKGYVAQMYSLGDMWRDIMENERGKLSVGDITDTTYYKYKLAKAAFYAANGFDDSTIAQSVDLQHVHKFQTYLRENGMIQATIYNYHSRVKSAFTLAFNRGKIKANPYAGFKMDKGTKKDIVWLTSEELDTIAKKEFVSERLEKVRDAFLFQCYSGLSYADMAILKKEDLKYSDEYKHYYIEKRRVKTNQKYISVILSEGQAILEKYDYAIPVLTNQRYNAYLKEIQDVCGIKKVLHSHLGRATYTCILYGKSVSADMLKKLVGHYSSATTLKFYADLSSDTLLKAVEEAEGKQPRKETKIDITAITTSINDYFNRTIFSINKDIPLNKDMVAWEDGIMAQLIELKKNQETYIDYNNSFNKCVQGLSQRISFIRRKIKELELLNDSTNLQKARNLGKSYRRFDLALQGLDSRSYKNCPK